MEDQKIINSLKFYLLATSLKDKIRSGWKVLRNTYMALRYLLSQSLN